MAVRQQLTLSGTDIDVRCRLIPVVVHVRFLTSSVSSDKLKAWMSFWNQHMDWGTLPRSGLKRIRLPYAEAGSGFPLVLVHGSNADHRIWDRHRKILANSYRVIAVTQRYFGLDPWADAGLHFSISELADDLADFIQSLGVGPVAIAGWSFGGAVSLVVAVRNPGLVQNMFLYEPSLATFLTDPELSAIVLQDRSQQVARSRQLASDGDLSGAVMALMDDIEETVGTFDQLPADIRTMMQENARMLPLLFNSPPPPVVRPDDLRSLPIPVTIATGTLSRRNYRISATAAATLLPAGRLVEVHAARHLWPVSSPTEFSKLVAETFAPYV